MSLEDTPTATPETGSELVPIVARAKNGKFAKGVSGNPSGRRHTKAIRDLLEPHIPKIATALAKTAANTRHRDHVKAAVAVLDRYFGTPVQSFQHDVTITNALAEIDARIIEHDPAWKPLKAKENEQAAAELSREPSAGPHRENDGGTIDGAKPEAGAAAEPAGAEPID